MTGFDHELLKMGFEIQYLFNENTKKLNNIEGVMLSVETI